MYDNKLRVDWVDDGTTFIPNVGNLLRFVVYVKNETGVWVVAKHASHYTKIATNTPAPILEKALRTIFDCYFLVRHLLNDPSSAELSIKRIGENLSEITANDFAE